MLRRLLYILFGMCLANNLLTAQLVQVSGYVYTSDSSGVVPYANIHNKKTKTATQANISGFYTILVAPGDTVEITAIGYKKSILCLPASYSGMSFHYDVPLKHITYTLPSFTKYYMDMEIFTREFTAMQVPEEKRFITVDKGQITSKAPVRETFGYTLNGPFSWLYNKFSRKAREMEKLADLRANELENFTAAQRLTPQFISLATGLPEDKTMDLAAYCDISYSALANYSNYDLIITLQRCLDVYKKDKNLTDEDLGIKPAPVDSINLNNSNK